MYNDEHIYTNADEYAKKCREELKIHEQYHRDLWKLLACVIIGIGIGIIIGWFI